MAGISPLACTVCLALCLILTFERISTPTTSRHTPPVRSSERRKVFAVERRPLEGPWPRRLGAGVLITRGRAVKQTRRLGIRKMPLSRRWMTRSLVYGVGRVRRGGKWCVHCSSGEVPDGVSDNLSDPNRDKMEGNSKSPENSPKENSLESKKPPNPVSKPPDGLSTNPSLQHSETDTDRFEGSSLSLQDVSARTLPTETTKTNRFDGEMDNHKENIAVEAEENSRGPSAIDLCELWENNAPASWHVLTADIRDRLEHTLGEPDFKKLWVRKASTLKRGNIICYVGETDSIQRPSVGSGHFGQNALVEGHEMAHPKYFSESVILLVQHSNRGSVGLMLNRFTQFKIGEVCEGKLPRCSHSRIFLGGDTGNGRLTVLHGYENMNGSVRIKPGVLIGGDASSIEAAISSKLANVSDFKWIINQCGWGPGQLEEEIRQGHWMNLETSADVIHSPMTTSAPNTSSKHKQPGLETQPQTQTQAQTPSQPQSQSQAQVQKEPLANTDEAKGPFDHHEYLWQRVLELLDEEDPL